MIRFTLKCANGHEFDGWFRDNSTFDAQVAAGEVACAVCGDTAVSKALTAPAVISGRQADARRARAFAMMARRLHEHVRNSCEHVGDAFPERARAMHYGEEPARAIYGEATAEEGRALVEEGIEIGVLPPLPRQDD